MSTASFGSIRLVVVGTLSVRFLTDDVDWLFSGRPAWRHSQCDFSRRLCHFNRCTCSDGCLLCRQVEVCILFSLVYLHIHTRFSLLAVLTFLLAYCLLNLRIFRLICCIFPPEMELLRIRSIGSITRVCQSSLLLLSNELEGKVLFKITLSRSTMWLEISWWFPFVSRLDSCCRILFILLFIWVS